MNVAASGGMDISIPRDQVTLIVYGWRNVEPGTLSWVFPNVGAAVEAARAMSNASRWAVLEGSHEIASTDITSVLANSKVLIEQN